jgi:hypothetical protein
VRGRRVLVDRLPVRRVRAGRRLGDTGAARTSGGGRRGHADGTGRQVEGPRPPVLRVRADLGRDGPPHPRRTDPRCEGRRRPDLVHRRLQGRRADLPRSRRATGSPRRPARTRLCHRRRPRRTHRHRRHGTWHRRLPARRSHGRAHRCPRHRSATDDLFGEWVLRRILGAGADPPVSVRGRRSVCRARPERSGKPAGRRPAPPARRVPWPRGPRRAPEICAWPLRSGSAGRAP